MTNKKFNEVYKTILMSFICSVLISIFLTIMIYMILPHKVCHIETKRIRWEFNNIASEGTCIVFNSEGSSYKCEEGFKVFNYPSLKQIQICPSDNIIHEVVYNKTSRICIIDEVNEVCEIK